MKLPSRAVEFSIADAHVYDRRSPGRWFISHLLKYWPVVLYVMVGTIVFVSLRSYIPVLVGQAFEVVTVTGSKDALVRVALTLVGVAIVQGLINLTTAYSNEMIAQRIERDAREELLVSLLSKSQTFHDQQRIGDVMARATNDVKQLNLMVSPALNLIYQSSLSLFIPLIIITSIHPQLLLAPMTFALVAGFALRRYIRRLGPISGRMRMQFGQMNAVLNETLSNIKVVRNFVQDGREKQVFSNHASAYRDSFVANGDVQARYLPLLMLGVTIGLGLLHALFLLKQGAISFGQVVSYVGLLGVLRFPTFISIFSFNLVQIGLASAARILELIESRTDIDQNLAGHEEPIQGRIHFEGVSFQYSLEGPPVLQDITFEVPPGARVAVVGPTGSGKTTLIKLLQRLYDVTEGSIRIDGVDVRQWKLDALRSNLTVIEQDTFLFSRTLAENIAFGRPDATRDEIEQAARTAQAHEFIQGFEKGYETVVGTRGVTLSGGQKQRIAIARALLSDPRILALDDATSAVDSATEDSIQKAMAELMRGRTSVVITHRLAQIRHADLILVMKRGRVVAKGTHEQLIRSSPDYREVFEVYGATLPPLETESSSRHLMVMH